MQLMKNFFKEFKIFITRGSVMDLAVAVIIGGAFQAIVNSFVKDLIMPLISLITGGIDFSNLFIQLDGEKKFTTLKDAQDAGVATFAYGNFITALINFLLIALVIFFVISALNKLRERTAPAKVEAPSTMKTCPFCQSEIDIKATRCPHCTSTLLEETVES